MKERVQKLMARAGLGSRRTCEKQIREGRVRLNGRLVRLGDRADAKRDRLELDGKLLRLDGGSLIYIALHKPRGVISSLEDELEQGRTTVRELVAVPGHIYPVGRLDKQSSGLILLTNDGELAHVLTHPRYGHEKLYRVLLDGPISGEQIHQWREGVWLDERRTAQATVTISAQEEGRTELEIIMREGRKRQIRRIATIFGLPVIELVRERIGPLQLGDLAPGQWRFLSAPEIDSLRQTIPSPDK
jgi:pseudouridine synthase